MDLKDQRIDYTKFELMEDHAGSDPFALFKRWFNEASTIEIEPNVMIISTSHNSQPETRVVLLKELVDEQFVFYTNYNSRKGQAIQDNPHVSLLFFWQQHQRQVRINGIATKVPEQQSDDYFKSRPIESQIGAIASTQSSILEDRSQLELRMEELKNYYKFHPIERPAHWGGYQVKPMHFEFWQGRTSRLHDRICFDNESGSWNRKRLYP